MNGRLILDSEKISAEDLAKKIGIPEERLRYKPGDQKPKTFNRTQRRRMEKLQRRALKRRNGK